MALHHDYIEAKQASSEAGQILKYWRLPTLTTISPSLPIVNYFNDMAGAMNNEKKDQHEQLNQLNQFFKKRRVKPDSPGSTWKHACPCRFDLETRVPVPVPTKNQEPPGSRVEPPVPIRFYPVQPGSAT
ncbi:hypothetical protein AMTR_s00162p00077300 [Amborella trichopoda]|uniref:Uncharacterized protein n=1 Tax=Amborella trichopoda TaxID=13333 RepID=W1PQ71_AMBTC|nr:hypothetical protein AMTR_s00162p00077300 [Amborella trichopoda]